jgi:sodium/potassium-transporting ATPase subunit alpha
MTVTDCLVGKETLTANVAAGIMAMKSSSRERFIKSLKLLAEIGGLCNAGDFDASESHLPPELRKVHGDATDQAILRFSEALCSVTTMRDNWRRIFRVAFNSRNKFMVQLIQPAEERGGDSKSPESLLTIKGAPDILLPRCSGFLDENGNTMPLTFEHRSYLESVKDKWSAQGKRVILLALKPLSQKIVSLPIDTQQFEDAVMEEAGSDLEFVGIIAIVDPPRSEIPEVISTLRGAGIKVHMVTGDFKLTAQAIAIECGIVTVPIDCIEDAKALSMSEVQSTDSSATIRAITLSGEDMKGLDEIQWDKLCKYDEIVFARTTPEQKLRIVKELQARGEIVGMTGDGVNDAPSLKAADIGIAMGSGSDIAIEAADMVLLDSFAAIVEAVKYGRVVFGKSPCYDTTPFRRSGLIHD